jgi:excisionase family DNA binding protein
MPEVLAHFIGLAESVWSILGPIGIVALIAGGLAFYIYEGDIEEPGDERERIRAALEAGGDLRRFYVWLLTHGLNWLDRFLADKGKAAFSLPSPFGNRERWPFWTGWSFDRCALLAVIYPLASLFVVWVWTGESGVIGDRLGLENGMVWWSRIIIAAVTSLIIFAACRARFSKGFRVFFWLAVACDVAFVVAGAVTGIVAVALVIAFAVVVAVAVTTAVTVAVTVAATGDFAGAVAVTAAVAVTVVVVVKWSEQRDRLGQFWLLFWPVALGAWCLGFIGLAWAGASLFGLSLVLMFGLVPLVNLPFDWFSLGLTRALLRRGCEPNALSPLWLGLLDFVFGMILLIVLALALIAALQQADAILIHFGRKPAANVTVLLHHIADDPRDAGNFWAYFTLFSTLIPSVLNATIGAVSLIGWWWRPARLWALSQFDVLDELGLPDQPGLLDVRGAAALLGVSANTVYALFRKGELPGRKVGRKWITTKAAVLRWIESSSTGDTPARAIESGEMDALARAMNEGKGRRHLGTRRRIAVLLGVQVGLGTALVGVALWGLWEMLLEAPHVLSIALEWFQKFAAALA